MDTQRTQRDRTEDMEFPTFLFEGGEAGRLREYRSKIDTHLLSAILFQVNMAHKYRSLQPVEMGEMGDVVSNKGRCN